MENGVTSERRAVRISTGYQPLDRAWLNGDRDYVGVPPSEPIIAVDDWDRVVAAWRAARSSARRDV